MNAACPIRLLPREQCVYTHSFDGKVFYVGMGGCFRPFQEKARSHAWNRIVEKADYIDVEIVKWFSRERDAREYERSEIARLIPAANRTGPGVSGKHYSVCEGCGELSKTREFARGLCRRCRKVCEDAAKARSGPLVLAEFP